jgi:hypothetical protein
MQRKERNWKLRLGAPSYLHFHSTISGFDIPTPGWFRPDCRRELSIRRILLSRILRRESLYLGHLGEIPAVGLVVALVGTLNGVMNATGSSSIAMYLLFTLGFVFFQFAAPPK